MDMKLSGSRVLVTGASRGIGFGIAKAFAREGCETIMVAREYPQLQLAAQQIFQDTGNKPKAAAMSISAAGAADDLASHFPDVDILVNNAGAVPQGNLQEIGEQVWRESWDLKVFGYINLARAFMPLMKKRSRMGVILNIIGVAGEMFDSSYIAGSVGNAALMAFTRAIGSSSPSDNVRMVGINPGPVATDRHRAILKHQALRRFGEESRWPEILADLPQGRAGLVEEIAAMAVMLASPLSGYTSGVIVTVDSGYSLRRK